MKSRKKKLVLSTKSAKTLGISSVREFTAPDGAKFSHFSQAAAHVRKIKRRLSLDQFMLEHHFASDVRDLIHRHADKLKELL